MDCVAAFFLAIGYFKPERRFGKAVDLAVEVPAFIVKKSFAVSYEEL
jgi:hypothetical protein